MLTKIVFHSTSFLSLKSRDRFTLVPTLQNYTISPDGKVTMWLKWGALHQEKIGCL